MYHDYGTKTLHKDPTNKVKWLFWPSLKVAPRPVLALSRALESLFLLVIGVSFSPKISKKPWHVKNKCSEIRNKFVGLSTPSSRKEIWMEVKCTQHNVHSKICPVWLLRLSLLMVSVVKSMGPQVQKSKNGRDDILIY